MADRASAGICGAKTFKVCPARARQGGKLRFVYHRKLRVALPAFIAGFVTCAWMGLVKKPPW